MRPVDPSVSAAPGLAQLCSLAYIKVPNLEEDFGQEAAEYLSEATLNSGKEFRAKVEDKDTSGGKVKGQGTGTVLGVTLVAVDAEISINAAMLQVFFLVAQISLALVSSNSLYTWKTEQNTLLNFFLFKNPRKDLLG